MLGTEVGSMEEDEELLERPFVLTVLGVLDAAVGMLLVLGSGSRLTVDGSSGPEVAAFAIGLIGLLVGVALMRGARWAYRVTLVLVPMGFLASIASALLSDNTFLVLALAFGAATLVLYGSRRLFAGTRTEIAAWFGRRDTGDAEVHALVDGGSAAGGKLAA
jgi:hypothetical protein